MVLDTVGVILHGNRTGYIRRLALSSAGRSTNGGAAVLGWGHRLAPHLAGWINASGGTVHELDEGHRFARGHPGIGVVPTVLALAQAMGLSGADTLDQIVLGYEFSAKMAQAIGSLKPVFHPHGICGTLGATFAATRTLGLSDQQVENAVLSVASLSIASGRAAVTAGASIRNLYAGFAVLNGMLCAEAAGAGVTAPSEALAAYIGMIGKHPFDPADTLSLVGKPFEITRNYFKRHATCAHVHAALDALERAVEENGIEPDKIRFVRVETYPEAAALSDWTNLTPVSAKFSIPYAISARLVSGQTGPSVFEPDVIECVRRSGWLERIAVAELDNEAGMMPDWRPARVVLTLKGGNKTSTMVHLPQGHFDHPFAPGMLEEKFRSLTKGMLTGDQQDTIIARTRELECLEHLADYFGLLVYACAKDHPEYSNGL
jgi:2-methylcitrate dehydratase PrpD